MPIPDALIACLDSLRADALFGFRRLGKSKLASAAAILSLALAIGACTSAFRLIDALLLRPLPVAAPDRLYALTREMIGFDGKPSAYDSWAYPAFRLMRNAVKAQAELIAVSYVDRTDLTYTSDEEMEKAYTQYVSGWMFNSLGIQPALGRLFNESDDIHLGARPYAVLSHDYWARRFGEDPKVIGRTFHLGNGIYQIIGVARAPFTGTETGTVTDIFIPTMMNPTVERSDAGWLRTLVLLKPGVGPSAVEPLRAHLDAVTHAFEMDRFKGFTGVLRQRIDRFINQKTLLEPAAAGISGMQEDYRRSLVALSVLVALVLLIACANVANLLTAQAASRAREMALRVSVGAGKWRLLQLVLVESAWLAFSAAGLGALFAWWSAPFVVSRINPPDNPARLILPADWRVLGFGVLLTLGVTFLFGLAPALRASSVKPASALKGGDDPHSRRRLMHALIAVQVAFCFLVLFVAGLFVTTFERLSHLPTGFSADRLLNLETVTHSAQPPVFWSQVADHLRSVPGVEAVGLSAWPLLSGEQSNSFISINGASPSDVLAYFLAVSPRWLDAMKIQLIDGRDFRPADASPGAAIVNEAFVKQFFNGENPVGRSFNRTYPPAPVQIVGLVRDARYQDMRKSIPPLAYVPFQTSQPQRRGTFVVRTASPNPMALASLLRREVARARSEFRVSNIRTQEELNRSHTIRERLLAMLSLFFAAVALLLAAVGLYGVLDYSVLQRRREIGIRMAIGAQPGVIARLVTTDVFSMVLAGSAAGIVLGLLSARPIESLFYQVKPTDLGMLLLPALSLFVAASLAALPSVIRAVCINPLTALRAD
jgi:predicted permease